MYHSHGGLIDFMDMAEDSIKAEEKIPDFLGKAIVGKCRLIK
jgi:hypothetical protein